MKSNKWQLGVLVLMMGCFHAVNQVDDVCVGLLSPW